MLEGEVRVGDVGTVFEVTVWDEGRVVDISNATTMELIFSKPDNTIVTKPAILSTNGKDGKMKYVTVAGDVDVAGVWRMQGRIVSSAWSGKTTIYNYRVEPNL